MRIASYVVFYMQSVARRHALRAISIGGCVGFLRRLAVEGVERAAGESEEDIATASAIARYAGVICVWYGVDANRSIE